MRSNDDDDADDDDDDHDDGGEVLMMMMTMTTTPTFKQKVASGSDNHSAAPFLWVDSGQAADFGVSKPSPPSRCGVVVW